MKPLSITPEEHQEVHRRLHKEFDELLACYLSENRHGRRTSIHDEIFALMQWNYRMTLEPQPGEHPSVPDADEFLIAQNDDPELLEWLAKADQEGGGFVKAIASAGLRADMENYALIRPLLVLMRAKYPAYEPSDAVKQEIRERVKP
jgi:hypothetical protein